MTEKIYETNSYINEFTARVISCEQSGDSYKVILDKSAFFPEEGGQTSDTGYIAQAQVVKAEVCGEDIIHITACPIPVGEVVCCTVNFEQRFYKMQNHTGEHIVSGIIKTHFGYNNVGFHLNDCCVTLDVDGALTRENIEFIEAQANKAVYENKKVIARYLTVEEQTELDFRSKISPRENLRLVEIEDTDKCACCAPHVRLTGEVGMIKITDFASHRGGTRITIYCGELARAHYEKTYALLAVAMKNFSANYSNFIEKINASKEETVKLKSELNKLKCENGYLTLKPVEKSEVVYALSENLTPDILRYSANKLMETTDKVVVVVNVGETASMYALGAKSDKAKDYFESIKRTLKVKGGFNANFSQGKIENTKSEIIEFLER